MEVGISVIKCDFMFGSVKVVAGVRQRVNEREYKSFNISFISLQGINVSFFVRRLVIISTTHRTQTASTMMPEKPTKKQYKKSAQLHDTHFFISFFFLRRVHSFFLVYFVYNNSVVAGRGKVMARKKKYFNFQHSF